MSWYMSCLIIIIIIILLILFKIFVIVTTGHNNNYVCLIGKTVIITGANSGKCNIFVDKI